MNGYDKYRDYNTEGLSACCAKLLINMSSIKLFEEVNLLWDDNFKTSIKISFTTKRWVLVTDDDSKERLAGERGVTVRAFLTDWLFAKQEVKWEIKNISLSAEWSPINVFCFVDIFGDLQWFVSRIATPIKCLYLDQASP